jgi:signal transduction histidine kinase
MSTQDGTRTTGHLSDHTRRVVTEVALLSSMALAELVFAVDWRDVASPPRPIDLVGPALTLVVFTLLWWRARRPVLVLGIVAVICLGSLPLPSYHPVFGILVALYAVTTRRSTRTSVAAMGVVALVVGLVSGLGWPDHPYEQVWVTVGIWWLIVLLVWLVAWRFNGHARTVEELERRRAAAAAAAVAAERMRLARELHDIVSHAVSGMVLQAAGARTVLGTDPRLAERAMLAVEDLGHEAMDELRRLLDVLRASGGDDAGHDGDAPGLDAIPTLIRHAQDSGVHATLATEGAPGTLAPSVDLTAYRIVQEALTNTVKHAGPGATARVRLRWSPPGSGAAASELPTLAIEVEDENAGATHPPAAAADLSGGLGLIGLAERVGAIGGRFDARPHGHGFLVTATLPAAGGRIDITDPSPGPGPGPGPGSGDGADASTTSRRR